MLARVNGEEWSRGSTSTLTWSLAEIVAYASRNEVVVPGQVIGSGTVGLGCGLELFRKLKPGDVVELEIEGIGTLRNTLAEPSPTRWDPEPQGAEGGRDAPGATARRHAGVRRDEGPRRRWLTAGCSGPRPSGSPPRATWPRSSPGSATSAGSRSKTTTRSGAGRSTISRRFWRARLGLLRRPVRHAAHADPCRADDAGRVVVRGRAGSTTRRWHSPAPTIGPAITFEREDGSGASLTSEGTGRRGRFGGRRAARSRRRPRRSRGRVPAQHPGGGDRVPGLGEHRRGLVVVLARLRRAGRDRPVPADRTVGAVRGRELPVRRLHVRSTGRARRDRRCDPLHEVRGRAGARRPRRSTRRRTLVLARADRATRGAGLRARPVRPPAVDPLLVRDDRPAEGDGAGARRHPPGTPQVAVAPPRPRPRFAVSSGSRRRDG